MNTHHTVAELSRLTLGFVPLTDAALLVIAREGGFFAEQGVDVTLSRENAWSTLRDKVAAGLLDGAHMLAPMPLAMSLGLGRAPCDTLAPITLSRNGNAVVLSSSLCEASGAVLGDDPAASAKALGEWTLGKWTHGELGRRDAIRHHPRLAMVYPFSCQHYQLQDWLALGGLDPQRDVELLVLPPPRMVEALQAGTIDGFCAGEPWGSLAAHRDNGRIVATGAQLWPDQPEKVLGVTRSWAHRYPATLAALLRGIAAASDWLGASPEHSRQARDWLALPPYLDHGVHHLNDLNLNRPPIAQQLYGDGVLRPSPALAERFAEYLQHHLTQHGRRLDIATLSECYSPVHFDDALHH